jgi:multicomponent Na+:H+ antiporter subunit D
MRLYFLIIAPVALGLLMYLHPVKKLSKLTLSIQFSLVALSISNFIYVKSESSPLIAGVDERGLMGIALYSDLIASVFIILISSLFFIFALYSYDSLLENQLFPFLFFSLESMILLIFLSRDLFNIFIAIEISTILCALLITFKRESRSIYDGMIFLMSNTVAALFFLFGVAMLYKTFGALDISYISSQMVSTERTAVIIPYALIMTGIAFKCAVIPLFSWMPRLYHGTPGTTPLVSAILSGAYVNGSIYLYIRLREMFLPAINLDSFFIALGVVMSLFGIAFALMQVDMKLILAYSTISQMGLIIIALSINDEYTKAGGLLHIMNHAMFKSLLFMASGMISYQYKTRNINRIRGVFRKLPVTGLSMIVGILGVVGAPLFNGSLSKYFIQSGIKGVWIESLIVFINFGTILYFVKFATMLLPSPVCNTTEPESRYRTGALGILGVSCLITGLSASSISSYFLDIDVVVDLASYLEKIALWIVLISVSIATYGLFIHKKIFFEESPDIDFSFNNISLSIVCFFFLILGVSCLA